MTVRPTVIDVKSYIREQLKMKNNNIGCFGWGIIIFIILLVVSYWQVTLPLAIIGAICWYFYEKSPKTQEKKKKQAAAKQVAEEERQKQIKIWETEDLSQYATKLTDVKLKKTEYAIYAASEPITWSESRTRTKRINYGGLTSNVHIMKGLNYRAGSIRTVSQKEEYMQDVLTGALALTNRRIIVVNGDKAKSYPFTRLLRIEPYRDGTELISDSGKKVILSGFKDATRFNIYLDRVTSD